MQSHVRLLRKRDSQLQPGERRRLERLLRTELKPKDIAKFRPTQIIQRLNAKPHSVAVKRVSRFIQLFNRARELNASFRLFFETKEDMYDFLSQKHPEIARYVGSKDSFSSGWVFKSPEMQALNERLNQTLKELNRMAMRYKWHPFIRHMGYELMDFDVTETWKNRGAEQEWETDAIWWLCAERGKWIDYCRQCRCCTRWFFAMAEHQSYCGDSCRKRYASRSEEFKEKRRLYMRAYRRAEVERDRRAKMAARRGQ